MKTHPLAWIAVLLTTLSVTHTFAAGDPLADRLFELHAHPGAGPR